MLSVQPSSTYLLHCFQRQKSDTHSISQRVEQAAWRGVGQLQTQPRGQEPWRLCRRPWATSARDSLVVRTLANNKRSAIGGSLYLDYLKNTKNLCQVSTLHVVHPLSQCFLWSRNRLLTYNSENCLHHLLVLLASLQAALSWSFDPNTVELFWEWNRKDRVEILVWQVEENQFWLPKDRTSGCRRSLVTNTCSSPVVLGAKNKTKKPMRHYSV